jgi:hypothetical protein
LTDLLLRGLASIAGLLLVLAFLQSVSRVAVVNLQRGDRLARRIGWLVYAAIARLARHRRSYAEIQDALAWILPLYILCLIATWFAMVQAGFSLLIWASQAEHSLLQAVIASGSALSTLGFLTPPGVSGQLLAIPEGALGLGIVVFFFTFIPGYQTTVQTREVKVAWLYARIGPEPVDFSLVEWLQRSGQTDDLTNLWEDWEAWFRLLIETHTIAPVVAFVPTVHRGQTWLIAAAVILDTASFWLASQHTKGLPSAALCHATGVQALRLIAAQHSAAAAPEPSVAGRRSARLAFDTVSARMLALGAHVNPDRDACWRHFVALRREYEAFLQTLATGLLIPVEAVTLLPLAKEA